MLLLFGVTTQVQRSVSQGDMNDANGRRIRSSNAIAACSATNNGTKLKRCASLPAQKQRSVPYMSSKETENLKLQLESSVESLGEWCIAYHYKPFNSICVVRVRTCLPVRVQIVSVYVSICQLFLSRFVHANVC